MRSRLPLVVLTGGIASGKTTVSDRLAECGAYVLDADVIAHEMTQPGGSAYDDIVDHWGDEVIIQTGPLKDHIDRRQLRSIVFRDASQRRKLEEILHPKILAELHHRLTEPKAVSNHTYAVAVIPLYAELNLDLNPDAVVVVDVTEATQMKRLISRDQIDETLAGQMIASQASREMRLAKATDVITNEGNINDLLKATEKLDKALQARLTSPKSSS